MSKQAVTGTETNTGEEFPGEAPIRTVRGAVVLALGEAASPLTEGEVKAAAARLAGLTSTTADVLQDVLSGFVANRLVKRIPGDSRHLGLTAAGRQLYLGLKGVSSTPPTSDENSIRTAT